MKKLLLLPLFLLSLTIALQAGNERKCGTDEYLKALMIQDPGLESQMMSIESFTQRYIAHKSLQRENAGNIVRIPVVVHVLWRTAAENISDAQVQSQIDVLNEDFRKLNSDFNQTLPEFIDRGADFEIEFCLASTDPSGNPTNGIERKQTTKVSWGTNDAMKKTGTGGLAGWNSDNYLNLWVCNLSGGVLGYATFPGGTKALDGVVILTTAFGRTGNVQAPFDLGTTATHEVGHWLNLRHIWGDAQPTCGSDLVNDTPKANGPNYGCPLSKTSCSNKNMVQNYMDYTDDDCMTLFTQGQKDRSWALFAPGGARHAILSSTACGNVTPSCGTAAPVVSNIGNTSAGLSFSSVNNATGYLVEKSTDGTTWTPVGSGTNTAYNLSGLISCTSYQVKVTTYCVGIDTTVSSIVSFKTTGAACACAVPQNITVSNITYKSAKVTWTAVPSATAYEVRRKLTSSSTWVVFTGITNTYKVLTGHTSNKAYETQVRASCPNSGFSAWSPSVNYTSATYRLSGVEPGTEKMMLEPSFNIFPNPATSLINMEYFGNDMKGAEVLLIDVTGRVNKSAKQDLQNGTNTTLDIHELSNGIYFIRVMHEGRMIETQKVIISK